jgi:hypothetical protein
MEPAAAVCASDGIRAILDPQQRRERRAEGEMMEEEAEREGKQDEKERKDRAGLFSTVA